MNRTRLFVVISFVGIAFAAHATQPASGQLDNKPERLVWLQDAGFGMFVHWSIDSQIGSVISHSMVGASPEYLQWYIDELPKSFNPKRFDADEWMTLAKLAGMKYIVLTAKHHNGFCLWDTRTSDFKITNTPYGKDLLAEYVTAARRAGLAVGLYYSPEDFHFLHINNQTIRRRGMEYSPEFTEKYEDFMRRQVSELMTNYGTIDVLFIDGEPAEPTKNTAWRIQPNLLITRGAIETPEQHVPGKAPEGAWESNLTMGTQWQYKPTNDNYKSGRRIIEILIETRAKGGALLLNVGPKPDGMLPIEQEERLREVALWHAVNGVAIHDTRPRIVTREGNLWFTRGTDSNAVYVFVTGILGFAEAMYNTQWETSETTPLNERGEYSLRIRGLAPGTQYQYRAVVRHPQITMRGDHRQFTAK